MPRLEVKEEKGRLRMGATWAGTEEPSHGVLSKIHESRANERI
jgi:hypothetical protein